MTELPLTATIGPLSLVPGAPPPDRLADPFPGQCYELTIVWLLHHATHLPDRFLDRVDLTLVHGSIEGNGKPRIGHAWLELDLRGEIGQVAHDPVYGITCPVDDWYRFTSAEAAHTYGVLDALQHAFEFEHYGPWHDRPFGLADCGHGHQPNDCPYGCQED